MLGVIGLVASFGLFCLGERVYHPDRAHIETLMYLMLSVAGHLTVFPTRTRGPFWSIRPGRIWALFVWGYALIWFLVSDRVKLLGEPIVAAGDAALAEVAELGGDGGVILIDGDGNPGFSFNSAGMYRGVIDANGSMVAIYGDETN